MHLTKNDKFLMLHLVKVKIFELTKLLENGHLSGDHESLCQFQKADYENLAEKLEKML